MMYSLYNKATKNYLIHPLVGLWYTDSASEAEEMLKSCHEYLKSCGLDFMVEDVYLSSEPKDPTSGTPERLLAEGDG